MDEPKSDVFTIPARRCKRCGGLLTSKQGLRDGYGPCCLQKMRQEEAERRWVGNKTGCLKAAGWKGQGGNKHEATKKQN